MDCGDLKYVNNYSDNTSIFYNSSKCIGSIIYCIDTIIVMLVLLRSKSKINRLQNLNQIS